MRQLIQQFEQGFSERRNSRSSAILDRALYDWLCSDALYSLQPLSARSIFLNRLCWSSAASTRSIRSVLLSSPLRALILCISQPRYPISPALYRYLLICSSEIPPA